MAKIVATFKYIDGKKVTVGKSGSIEIRSPLALTIGQSSTRESIDFGLSCDRALLIIERRTKNPQSVVIRANEKIVIDVRNDSKSVSLIEAGDVLFDAYVLDSSGVEVK